MLAQQLLVRLPQQVPGLAVLDGALQQRLALALGQARVRDHRDLRVRVETVEERVEHMQRIRDLQDSTGGFISFISDQCFDILYV